MKRSVGNAREELRKELVAKYGESEGFSNRKVLTTISEMFYTKRINKKGVAILTGNLGEHLSNLIIQHYIKGVYN